MGNDNSTQNESILFDLFAKHPLPNENTDIIYKNNVNANNIVRKLFNDKGNIPVFDTDRKYSHSPLINTEQLYSSDRPNISSDDIKYVEFVVCTEDKSNNSFDNTKSRFAVNHEIPGHECGENCGCVMTVYDTAGKLRALSMKGGKKANKKGKKQTGRKRNVLEETSEASSVTSLGSSSDLSDNSETDMKLEDIPDISEEGIPVSTGSISSTELYKLQSRIFGSDTPDESYQQSDFTEDVKKAMNDIKNKDHLFDSEDIAIMNLTSKKSEPKSKTAKNKANKSKKYN